MNILLITEFFPDFLKLNFSGGVEARTFYIAKYLSRNNQTQVLCRRTKNVGKNMKKGKLSVYPNGFLTKQVEAGPRSILGRLLFMLTAFIKGLSIDFDVIEGSNFVVYLPAFMLGLIKRKPTIAWYADLLGKNWFKYFGLVGYFGYILEKISIKLPWTEIIALSKNTKSKLVSAGVKPDKITIVYGGVENLDQKSPQKSEKKNIICVARLVRYKRINDLINAYALLEKKHKNLSLTIVGAGPEEKYLKRLASKLKLKKIFFTKNLDRKNLLKRLQKAYIICLPSLVEGFGLVTIEAAALSTPYVISDTLVHREITRQSKGGLLFKAKNAKDLAIKIETLLQNNRLYQKKQKECSELVKNYKWSIIAKDTCVVYRAAVEGHK
jgi:glycosyltransferase involved in cell wall biosynthesis